jgi:hypothetical protein
MLHLTAFFELLIKGVDARGLCQLCFGLLTLPLLQFGFLVSENISVIQATWGIISLNAVPFHRLCSLVGLTDGFLQP